MIEFRPATVDEASYLIKWLSDPDILRWFPMCDAREVEDSVRIWMSYTKMNACFTAYVDGVVAGMSILYIQPYQKFAHQCLFAIIVGEGFRSKGIGKALIEQMTTQAKEKFHIEILHLEVYEGNPAYHLYERLGFQEYGRHPRFIKWEGKYYDKILMQKRL
jgi:RimJ/RimL family protein N-acetyltransferase